jgi:hypothetical protein
VRALLSGPPAARLQLVARKMREQQVLAQHTPSVLEDGAQASVAASLQLAGALISGYNYLLGTHGLPGVSSACGHCAARLLNIDAALHADSAS